MCSDPNSKGTFLLSLLIQSSKEIKLTKIEMNARNKWIDKEHKDNKSQYSQAFDEKYFVCYSVLKVKKYSQSVTEVITYYVQSTYF